MAEAHVASLRLCPVRGLKALPLQAVVLRPWGLEGDSRWMIADTSGYVLDARTCPALARLSVRVAGHGVVLGCAGLRPYHARPPRRGVPMQRLRQQGTRIMMRDVGDDAARWLRRAVGIACRLYWLPAPELVCTYFSGSTHLAQTLAETFPTWVSTECAHLSGGGIVLAGADESMLGHGQPLALGSAVVRLSAQINRSAGRTAQAESAPPRRYRVQVEKAGMVRVGSRVIPRESGMVPGSHAIGAVLVDSPLRTQQ